MLRTPSSSLLVLGAVGVLAAPGSSQQLVQGPATTLASGLSLRASAGNEATLMNPPGANTPVVPATMRPANRADYQLSMLFPDCFGVVELDGFSSGNATIPDPGPKFTASGRDAWSPAFGPGGRWMEVDVSYRGGTTPLPPYLVGRPNPASDLVGFAMLDSQDYDPQLLGVILLEGGSAALGLSPGQDIDALDNAIGVQAYATTTSISELFDVQDEFYFSVTPASASALESHYAANLGNRATFIQNETDVDPGAIYFMRWKASGTPTNPTAHWEAPQIFRRSADLWPGGQTTNVKDVDALDVDTASNNIIFSYAGVHPGVSQLLFHDYDSVKTYALGNGGGGLATEQLGGDDETTDVDAVCIRDPHALAGPGQVWSATHYSRPALTPVNPNYPNVGRISLSISRETQNPEMPPSNPATADAIHFHVADLQKHGVPDGMVFILVKYGYDPATVVPFDPMAWSSAHLLLRTQDEDELTHQQLVSALQMLDPSSWVAMFVDGQGQVVATSTVCVIRL